MREEEEERRGEREKKEEEKEKEKEREKVYSLKTTKSGSFTLNKGSLEKEEREEKEKEKGEREEKVGANDGERESLFPIVPRIRKILDILSGQNLISSLLSTAQLLHSPPLSRALTLFISEVQGLLRSDHVDATRQLLTCRAEGDRKGLLEYFEDIQNLIHSLSLPSSSSPSPLSSPSPSSPSPLSLIRSWVTNSSVFLDVPCLKQPFRSLPLSSPLSSSFSSSLSPRLSLPPSLSPSSSSPPASPRMHTLSPSLSSSLLPLDVDGKLTKMNRAGTHIVSRVCVQRGAVGAFVKV